MEKKDKKSHSDFSFSKPILNKNLTENHEDYLGMKLPEDFFEQSKDNILQSISNTNMTGFQKKIRIRRKFLLGTAAAVLLLIITGVLFLILNNSLLSPKSFSEESTYYEDDNIAFHSIFMEEGEIDDFINEYFSEDIILEAEVSSDNIIINSLLIDENEIDTYIDEYLIKELIL